MNITITKDDLSHALRRVQGAIASRTTLPILSYVLLCAKGESLQLVASNLDLQISHTVPAGVLGAGEVALNQSGLSAFVNQFGPQEISLAIDDKFKATLKSGGAVCSLSGTDAVEFPVFSAQPGQSFPVEQAKLKSMLRRTLFSVSTDSMRPMLNGVRFELKNGTLTIISTDGRRASRATHEIASNDISGTIPTKAATELMRLLSDEGDVTVSIGKSKAQFTLGNTVLETKLIDFVYPNWRQIIPGDCVARVTVAREELQSSIRLVSSIILEANKSPSMRADFARHVLKLKCVGESTASDSLAVKYDGKDFAITLNPDYVLDVLNALDDDEVHLEFTDDLSPFVIKADNFLGVIMPMRTT